MCAHLPAILPGLDGCLHGLSMLAAQLSKSNSAKKKLASLRTYIVGLGKKA